MTQPWGLAGRSGENRQKSSLRRHKALLIMNTAAFSGVSVREPFPAHTSRLHKIKPAAAIRRMSLRITPSTSDAATIAALIRRTCDPAHTLPKQCPCQYGSESPINQGSIGKNGCRRCGEELGCPQALTLIF
jgi:hypothetical protein